MNSIYTAKGWMILGAWLPYTRFSDGIQNAETIAETFNKHKTAAGHKDIPDITPAQIRYACRVMEVPYKRKSA